MEFAILFYDMTQPVTYTHCFRSDVGSTASVERRQVHSHRESQAQENRSAHTSTTFVLSLFLHSLFFSSMTPRVCPHMLLCSFAKNLLLTVKKDGRCKKALICTLVMCDINF